MRRSLFISFLIAFNACAQKLPEPIKINQDACSHCHMTIADKKFSAELITEKQRAYKFDDIVCMLRMKQSNEQMKNAICFVSDYLQTDTLIPADKAIFVKSASERTPMNGNIIAFSSMSSAKEFSNNNSGTILTWIEINE